MSHEAVHPFGESEIVRLVNQVLSTQASRRSFMKYAAVLACSTLAAGSLAELAFDIFPALAKNLVLTPQEETYLYSLLLDKKIGMGWYPDFDLLGDDALSQIEDSPRKREIPDQVGVFALLEDMYVEDVMRRHMRRLQNVRTKGYSQQLSLGMGSHFKPHPFAGTNTNEQLGLMKEWLDRLLRQTSGEITIRFLYEVNAYAGDISYKKPVDMTVESHQDSFKSIFESFASLIRADKEATSRFHLDLCFAASGRSMEAYFPQAPVRAVGVDVYPEPYGRLAVASLYDQMFQRLPSSLLQNDILLDLLSKARPFYGEQTKVALHEIGTTDDHLDWFKSALLLFLAAGGDEVLYFGYDKTVTEKMNYTINYSKRNILESLHL